MLAIHQTVVVNVYIFIITIIPEFYNNHSNNSNKLAIKGDYFHLTTL